MGFGGGGPPPPIPGEWKPPPNFQMKIPNAEYYSKQRSSVFQKVDLSGIDLAKIPIYEKSEEQLNEIIPLLKNNFLTKNLADEEIQSIAGAMKPEKFEVG